MADERDSKPEAVTPDVAVSGEDRLARFLGDPTRDLEDWHWLWHEDHVFPQHGRPGLLGRLAVRIKRFLQPLVRFATAELRERQRVFNLILIEELVMARHRLSDLDQHLRAVHRDHQGAIEAHAGRLEDFDARIAKGMYDVLAHNDALFARVDQKLDLYRRESRSYQSRLDALIAVQEQAGRQRPDEQDAEPALAAARREQSYCELERHHRGSEDEIRSRVEIYRRHLEDRGPVLDLGCGRGEALAMLVAEGLEAYGVDSSGTMVEHCRAQGLRVERDDLFAHLAGVDPESLGAVVSFHVIEHLPSTELDRLVRLAWRALRSGGVLILETPSPLSLVTSARNFWIDPTHRRPVHPASLEVLYREAGFEPVHRLDLHPYPDDQRLPEIELETLPEDQRQLADRVNRLRDDLDRLLYGHRDFALVGIKA